MPNMDNISILITVKKLALKTYSLAEVYPQSIISGLKDISQYGIIIWKDNRYSYYNMGSTKPA